MKSIKINIPDEAVWQRIHMRHTGAREAAIGRGESPPSLTQWAIRELDGVTGAGYEVVCNYCGVIDVMPRESLAIQSASRHDRLAGPDGIHDCTVKKVTL